MNKLILIIYLLAALILPGCLDQDFTPEQMKQIAGIVEPLNAKVDDYQAATSEVMNTLKTRELITEKTVKEIVKAGREIDRVQPQISSIANAIKAANLGDDNVANWITLLQAANLGSTPWNPYALPITAALTLATTIYGLVKRKEAGENELKYKAHKQGVEKTMKEMSASESGKDWEISLYETIGDARAHLGVK